MKDARTKEARTKDSRTEDEARPQGFWHSIPGILTAGTGILTALAGLIVALSQAGVLGRAPEQAAVGPAGASSTSSPTSTSSVVSPPGTPTAAAGTMSPAAAIDGRWKGKVSYPWGLEIDETFVFRVEGDKVIGTATYLGAVRGIVDGKVTGDRVKFFTRAEEILGSETRSYENHYDGLITIRGIQFVLQDTRDTPPIDFAMTRSY